MGSRLLSCVFGIRCTVLVLFTTGFTTRFCGKFGYLGCWFKMVTVDCVSMPLTTYQQPSHGVHSLSHQDPRQHSSLRLLLQTHHSAMIKTYELMEPAFVRSRMSKLFTRSIDGGDAVLADTCNAGGMARTSRNLRCCCR